MKGILRRVALDEGKLKAWYSTKGRTLMVEEPFKGNSLHENVGELCACSCVNVL